MASTTASRIVLADILQPDRNSFGVIRLLMALAVLVSHSYFFVTGNPLDEPLVLITGHSLGEHAVQVFFFLSGVLVTQSYIKSGSIIDFGAARALRIFPGLIVCVLVTALLLGPALSTLSPAAYFADPLLLRYIAKSALLVTGAAPLPATFQDLPAAGLVNMSLWTLKYEVLCYFVLGVAGAAGIFAPRYRVVTIAAAAIFVTVVFLKVPGNTQDYTNLENVRYFALYFTTGVLACLVKDHLVLSGAGVVICGAAFAALIGTAFGEVACAVFLGYATMYAASIDFGVLKRVTHETDLSFGVYIYAAPIQQGLVLLFPGQSPLGLALLAGLITLPVALVSWQFVEKPALRARRPIVEAIRAKVGRSQLAGVTLG